eukprot:scaffold41462_cov20-Cyclotella_meneghiniana.AAC.1
MMIAAVTLLLLLLLLVVQRMMGGQCRGGSVIHAISQAAGRVSRVDIVAAIIICRVAVDDAVIAG